MASMESQRNTKEKRLSAGNNLEAISEEKDAKDDPLDAAERGKEEDADDSTKPKVTDTGEDSGIPQESSLLEGDAEEVLKDDKNVTSSQSDDNSEKTKEESLAVEDPPSKPDTTQIMIDIDDVPPISSAQQEHQEFSSSSSSSDDDDADAALSNLEGFTPLVDLKLKK